LSPTEEIKSQSTSYAFWCLCLVGLCGVHRIYNGQMVSGVIWLLTGGLCGIGQIIDLFLIPGMVEDANRAA
jgi:TM2 domain-containing membrane protein YozV